MNLMELVKLHQTVKFRNIVYLFCAFILLGLIPEVTERLVRHPACKNTFKGTLLEMFWET